MGFFGKIKDNLNHGGVDITLQAPASASMQDASLPVTITVTNTSGQQHIIKSIKAEVVATSQNQNFGDPNNPSNSTQVTNNVVARADYAQQFPIMPAETKSVQVNIVMNAGSAIASQIPEGSGLAQVAGALQKLQSIGEALNPDSYSYTIRATADVEGIGLDPMKSQPIQILKPGQIGTAFNI